MEMGDAEMDGDGGGADQRRWLCGARHRPPDLEPCFSGLGVVAVAIEDGGAGAFSFPFFRPFPSGLPRKLHPGKAYWSSDVYVDSGPLIVSLWALRNGRPGKRPGPKTGCKWALFPELQQMAGS